MFEDFAPKLARVLTEYSHPIQKGDYVGIVGEITAQPLMLALSEAVLRRGGHPHVTPRLTGAGEIYMRVAQDHQLDFCDPIQLYAIDQYDVLYQIMAPTNTKAMSKVDPARLARAQQGSRPYIERYLERCAEDLRWNITAWPTPSAAQEAERGLLDYTEFMYKAMGLDQPDPVAYWENIKTRQQKLVDWLVGKSEGRYVGPGIDITFNFAERPWINSWGNHNFPSGEIFTSPVEDSVNGTVEYSFPTMYGGREINGVKFTFKDGKVVDASADKGEDYLLSQLEMDEGARIVGEVAIGTNYGIQEFTGNTLFDEKIGGTIHIAIGQGFKEAGGSNQSSVHWDMVHDMKQGGEIYVDGELIYQNGQFVLA